MRLTGRCCGCGDVAGDLRCPRCVPATSGASAMHPYYVGERLAVGLVGTVSIWEGYRHPGETEYDGLYYTPEVPAGQSPEDWWVAYSPRNSSFCAEGHGGEWVALARNILALTSLPKPVSPPERIEHKGVAIERSMYIPDWWVAKSEPCAGTADDWHVVARRILGLGDVT